GRGSVATKQAPSPPRAMIALSRVTASAIDPMSPFASAHCRRASLAMWGPASGAPLSFAGADDVGAVVGCEDGTRAGSASPDEPSQAARARSTTAFRMRKLKHDHIRRACEKTARYKPEIGWAHDARAE